jgi:hypothetical protein
MKSGMQHQMDTIKELYGNDAEANEKNKKVELAGQEKDREIAELYEDVYQYKLDKKCFEDELVLVKKHELNELLNVLNEYKLDSRDYNTDLMGVIEHNWQQKIENNKCDASQLELIKGKDFNSALEILVEINNDTILNEIKDIFIARWEMLVEIKKEHIKEEEKEIKVRGLKTYYAERVYKRYHGLL